MTSHVFVSAIAKCFNLLNAIIVSFLIAECVVRWRSPSLSEPIRDERNLAYRYDQELGWFPKENSRMTIQGTHPFEVRWLSRSGTFIKKQTETSFDR